MSPMLLQASARYSSTKVWASRGGSPSVCCGTMCRYEHEDARAPEGVCVCSDLRLATMSLVLCVRVKNHRRSMAPGTLELFQSPPQEQICAMVCICAKEKVGYC